MYTKEHSKASGSNEHVNKTSDTMSLPPRRSHGVG